MSSFNSFILIHSPYTVHSERVYQIGIWVCRWALKCPRTENKKYCLVHSNFSRNKWVVLHWMNKQLKLHFNYQGLILNAYFILNRVECPTISAFMSCRHVGFTYFKSLRADAKAALRAQNKNLKMRLTTGIRFLLKVFGSII